MDLPKLVTEVESRGVENAAESFERLARAIEATTDAILRLGDQKHGGITVRIIGDIAECKVKPAR